MVSIQAVLYVVKWDWWWTGEPEGQLELSNLEAGEELSGLGRVHGGEEWSSKGCGQL